MYDIISAFQCYTISVDVYFSFHCTLWMACFTFLLILCYCCCAYDNDVSHTLHREWGVTEKPLKPNNIVERDFLFYGSLCTCGKFVLCCIVSKRCESRLVAQS